MSPPADAPDVRELDCDFCGATADGAYEPLPPRLNPTPDEQLRLALCTGCRGTLDGVVSPLLDRLDATDGTDADDSSGPPASPDDGGADRTGAPETDPIADPGSTSGDDVDTDPTPGDADSLAGGDNGAEATAGDSTHDTGAAAGTRETGAAGTAGTADVDEEPEEFRTVMRLLNNREFPVDRAMVTELAAGAYDLEDREVAEILEYAIERGILVEEGGQLDEA